ncbi:bacteriohemerythrin [Desulfoluna spongiiphila]|uniref:Hemerythrin n=1 Tax=Desulfoluna spongiiphila TaxID=419481 RepID=A0A1G5ATG6_9BACT|nr:bacteriohemerythrin [Desulfoluna spongiiphila]SCX81161.1 hemerythrin [Desulfoluna spongiiphila]VVS91999.1 haemerythrin-like [Desulfoluna spongiiphila]
MVSMLNWTDDMLVHIDEIDDQHRNLFLLINRLIIHKRNQGRREELMDLIRVLVAFAQTHFRTEDHHMAETSYPLAMVHSKEHLKFTERIKEFATDYEKGVEDLSDKMLSFLRVWWTTHVAGSDKKFATYLRNEGYIP